jgi:phosphohistidine swiveling domain-containing protein
VHSQRIVGSDQVVGLPATAVGGKAFALARLDRDGLPVPPWFCVTSAVFRDVTAPVLEALADDLARFDGSDAALAESISGKMAAAIVERGLSSEDRATLQDAVRRLLPDGSFVAVRSSAADEDSAGASFAGQMDSYLFVPAHEVEARILECFASCFSPRVLAYRLVQGRPPAREAAVIVQRMVDSAVSGVMFTANPTTGDTTEIVVSAALGLGEGVVADRVDADTFFLESATGAQRRRITSRKRSRVGFNHAVGAGTAVIDVSDAEAEIEALDPVRLAALSKLGNRIQDLFGCPQDVEWAFDAHGQMHVLQARPITTLSQERQSVFDNANIVESYPGLSSPMTFSFVRGAYERTFRAASRSLGVPDSVLRDNAAVHANLVALIDGSIYYNVVHMYKLFQFVPGFEGALPAWEQALGLKGIVPPRPPEPSTLGARIRARWRQLRVSVRLFGHFLRLDRQVDDFARHFAAVLASFKKQPLEQLDAHQLVELYEEVSERLLDRYSISVVNDAFVQQFHALVGRLMTRWELGDTMRKNDLFTGGGTMESVRPVQSLLGLAQRIRNDADLSALFSASAPEVTWQRLKSEPRFSPFLAEIIRHFEDYGDRTFQELKLETPQAEEVPELIIGLLSNYASPREGGEHKFDIVSRSAARRRAAEEAVAAGLAGHPLRRAVFGLVLGRTRRMVDHRENMRLMRSRAFGMVKRIIKLLGRRLASAGVIQQPQDVFYLSIEEAFGAVRGATVTQDLRTAVSQRRAEYERFATLPIRSRVTTRGVALASFAAGGAAAAVALAPSGTELQGIGCSAGRVRGRARVVRTPENHLNIQGEVLVAPMTDPGWVFLMIAAAGLVVERGSILSHTAIIGRELGIPTVVAVADATTAIADGQMLEIDGSAGTVRIVA